MAHDLQQLLGVAFSSAEARLANAEIARVRTELAALSGGEAWSYEVLLPEGAPDEFLMRETLPRLVYFLHSRGTPEGAGVFLSIFAGDRLHFVAAPDALAVLAEWSGLTLEQMKNRWADGHYHPPLALPGPSQK